jgi:hypothetical protein
VVDVFLAKRQESLLRVEAQPCALDDHEPEVNILPDLGQESFEQFR